MGHEGADLDRSSARGAAVGALPPERLLPDTQPVYVASWIYVFGVLTLAAFVVDPRLRRRARARRAGLVARLVGRPLRQQHCTSGAPSSSSSSWSSTSGASSSWPPGAAGAALTWITGAIVVPRLDRRRRSPATSPSRTSTRSGSARQAKDGLNASGVGAFFNVLNFGQMLLWHVVLLPLVVACS